jgi:hypothetical protein
VIDRLGLTQVDLGSVLRSGTIINSVGMVLGSISGFLGNFSFIFLLTLIFLGEGPALMNRLRAGEGRSRSSCGD